MFTNYIVVALRVLWRDKLYAAVNTVGLSIGISCCLVLGIYVSSEMAYDRHHENHEQIYRIVNKLMFSGDGDGLARSSRSLGPLLLADNPGSIKTYTRFKHVQSENTRTYIRYRDKSLYWDKVFLADQNVFNVFTHRLMHGDPDTALERRTSIAISESVSRAYFGNENPSGKILSSDGEDYYVTAVFEDLPETSHLKYDALLSMNSLDRLPQDDVSLNQQLLDLSLYTYVLMSDGFEATNFVPMLDRFYEKRIVTAARSFGLEDFSATFWVQNLVDIHLESKVGMDEPAGNKLYLLGMVAIAVLILLVACINYVNLSTARSLRRAREVGVRKVAGATRKQLIAQFLCESVMLVFVAYLVSLLLIGVVSDLAYSGSAFWQWSDTNILFSPIVLAVAGLIALIIGLVSGLYPALYLSRLSPKTALSSFGGVGNVTGGLIRQLLVLIQFVVAIGVIACALLMANQLNYISNLSLGFEKENKLLLTLRGANVIGSFSAIKNELLSKSSIRNVSITEHVPGIDLGYYGIDVETTEGQLKTQNFALMAIGTNFIDSLHIPLVEGRDFADGSINEEHQSVIVNRALVEYMNWETPIGKRFEGVATGSVIGVIDDFNFASAHHAVTPLILRLADEDFSIVFGEDRETVSRVAILDVSPVAIDQTIKFVTDVMGRFDSSHPIEYLFLSERLDSLYVSEQDVMKLTAFFAGVCVLLASLGLFGLTAFATETRTKEIGIRRVLGASSLQIVWLFLRNTLVLVTIAAAIASVSSYFVASKWLDGFAYKVEIDPAAFIVAALIVAAIASTTVVVQTLRTARADPVTALRYE